MSVDAIAAEIRRRDPSISESEAMAMAQAEMAPPSRLDGAPDVSLDELQAGSPLRRRYQYDPITGQTVPVVSDEEWAEEIKRDNSESGRYGSPWGTTDGFTSEQAADAYSYRAPGQPSQQDIDMLRTGETNPSGTGWVMRYGDDGVARTARRAPAPSVQVTEGKGPTVNGVPIADSPYYEIPEWDQPGQAVAGMRFMRDVGAGAIGVDSPTPEYMEGYDWGGVRQGWANEATGNQRVGPLVDNRDVQAEMPSVLRGGTWMNPRPEYDRVPTLVQTVNGEDWVWDYKPEYESHRKENAKRTYGELQLKRMAEQAGISMAEARRLKEEGGGSVQGIRDLISDRNNADKRDRQQAVRTRSMLAGNDPRQNLANAYNTLSPEDQRAAMLGMMFPDGATPLDVEEAAAAAVRETPLELMMRQRELDLMERQARQAEDAANPAAAGARHLSEGKYDTPEARQELDRLTLEFDTTYGGFSVENERRLAAALQQPPYSLPQAEAERIAYEQAQSRRWRSGPPPGAAPPPPSGPIPYTPPGMPPGPI